MTQKKRTFEKPNKNWRNPRKKYWQKLNYYNLPFKRQLIQIINVWKLRPVDGVLLHVCILQSMQHTQDDTKERELLKWVVAVK